MVLGAIFGVGWILDHLVEVIATSAVCGALALAAVVALMRWADRRDARRVELWRVRAETVGPPTVVTPVAGTTTRPALPFRDLHIHFDGMPDTEQAAVIRRAIGRTDQP